MERLVLKMKNYCGFKSTDKERDGVLEFPGITVLVGNNGTRKRDILSALIFYKCTALKQEWRQPIPEYKPIINPGCDKAVISLNDCCSTELTMAWLKKEQQYRLTLRNLSTVPSPFTNVIWTGIPEAIGYPPNFELAHVQDVTAGDLYISENPELQLYDTWQANIGDQLCDLVAQKSVRVVLDTNSEIIYERVRVNVANGKLKPDDALVYYFNRVDKDTIEYTQLKIDARGNLSMYPEGFFSQHTQNLLQLA